MKLDVQNLYSFERNIQEAGFIFIKVFFLNK